MLPVAEQNGLPFDIENSASYNAELKLYRAVIDQAIHDLGSPDMEIRLEAEEWFNLRDKSFIEICELAGMQPKVVYRAVRDHLDLIVKSKEPFNKTLEKYNVGSIEELTKLILKEHSNG